eukprot:COSAG06_NODE_581_length_14007_cov_3.569056_17_plen_161_part_00
MTDRDNEEVLCVTWRPGSREQMALSTNSGAILTYDTWEELDEEAQRREEEEREKKKKKEEWKRERKDPDAPTDQSVHSSAVHCIAWSHDGRYLASCSEDGSIKIWDAPSFSPDSPTLTAPPVWHTQLWEAHNEKESTAILSIAWSRCGISVPFSSFPVFR